MEKLAGAKPWDSTYRLRLETRFLKVVFVCLKGGSWKNIPGRAGE
jgi:hypothetical protein